MQHPIFRFNTSGKKWEQWILLTADRHHDSKHSNLKMQTRHHKQARERKAIIFDFGDLYDAMQGKKDFRGTKNDLKDDLKRTDYFNALIESGVNFWQKDKDMLKFICYGNHETAIIKHNEVDILKLMVDKLNSQGADITLAGYQGWIKLNFDGNLTGRQSLKIWYTHGSGGSAPVTKGTIKTNRRNAMIDGADIIISGHIHQDWRVGTPKRRLNDNAVEYIADVQHIQLPSYKHVAESQYGFEVEKEFAPTLPGAVWLRFFAQDRKVKYDIIKAS